MTRLDIRLLGEFAVFNDGTPLTTIKLAGACSVFSPIYYCTATLPSHGSASPFSSGPIPPRRKRARICATCSMP